MRNETESEEGRMKSSWAGLDRVDGYCEVFCQV